MKNTFVELGSDELNAVDGGDLLLIGCIALGAIDCLLGGYVIGYTLAVTTG